MKTNEELFMEILALNRKLSELSIVTTQNMSVLAGTAAKAINELLKVAEALTVEVYGRINNSDKPKVN